MQTDTLVDLFVRSWVEIRGHTWALSACQWSTSSWGRELKWLLLWFSLRIISRPLREVVSWNTPTVNVSGEYYGSTSSWGRELKFAKIEMTPSCANVDLFVRSWVEIHGAYGGFVDSSSRPLREVVSWNTETFQKVEQKWVDLFVRSWVEMNLPRIFSDVPFVDLFVRSWVEIFFTSAGRRSAYCRPLREVVSWNEQGQRRFPDAQIVDLFVRSWVEIVPIRFPFW